MEDNGCQLGEIDKPRDIFLGKIVHSKDEAYELYQEHGFKMGFSIRKGKELYYDNEKTYTRLKDFYCSKQGFKNNEPDGKPMSEVAYQRADSRTNCKAMVRFNVSRDGVWRITKLIMDHNHDFVLLEQRHLLRSMRNVSQAKGGILCSHALRIYNIKGILRIPDQYFLRRWSKKARYDHIHESSKEDSISKDGGDSMIIYRNAIMKFFYNLVLDSQEHKETQQIMWKLLDSGVQRVHQCKSELNLNSKATTSENNSTQNEDSEHAAICNPLLAKTKGMSNTRKKGHFEKRKRSTTKEKQHKKKKEDNFCSITASKDEPSNVLSNINNTSNVPSTSFCAPLEDYHSNWGLNTQIPFTSMLQGINSGNALIQESLNYNLFPPSSTFQDWQGHKRN